MNDLTRRVQRVYLTLTLGNTLAASFIWGINTLFLLDAGLSNLEAFAANAFFTAGMVLCDIPTGVVADVWGRRTSYLLGTLTLSGSTFLYWVLWDLRGPFWAWAIVSMLLGLGFTFFSGAVEAWLVDALHYAGYDGALEVVMGRGQMVGGVAMLAGSIAGGAIAQVTNLGVPFLIRVVVLAAMFVVASRLMRDLGFTPDRSKSVLGATREVLDASLEYGLKNPPVRWVMLSAPFSAGVGIYTFYALQPYLLGLYGDPKAYTVAGLAAAIVAGAQIVGGYLAPRIRRVFRRRTTSLILGALLNAAILGALGFAHTFWLALLLLVVWALVFAAEMPIRQAYLNNMIPSRQRATVLSFESSMGSIGGVIIQPTLGKVADTYSYAASLVVGGAIQLVSAPFLYLSRREHATADIASGTVVPAVPPADDAGSTPMQA
ncbi:MAG TPA: MFS transporter [Gaiellaceae bacterium]|jgi:MFS family permease|nr:MFS transporter [Gaiellaceae bacterium]